MNVSILAVMNNRKGTWLVENYKILYKQFFKIGLDITQFAIVEDLLGIDYKSFSKGLTIFIEDEEKKASSLLVPLNHMEDCGNGAYIDPSNNIIIINNNILNSFDAFKNIVNDKLKINFDAYSIKCFGISEENLQNYLNDYKKSNNIFDFYVQSEYGDSLIIFRFLSSIDSNIKDRLISVFVKDLKGAFYASKDINLAQAVYEILSLRHLKISIAETFTLGCVVNELSSAFENDKSLIADAYVTVNNESKIRCLGISESIIKNYDATSAEVAYEMAISLLNINSCDLTLVICGEFETSKPTKPCVYYTAIGDSDAINVYRHKVVGDEQFAKNYAKNTIIFELIKKLRQNALNISNFGV